MSLITMRVYTIQYRNIYLTSKLSSLTGISSSTVTWEASTVTWEASSVVVDNEKLWPKLNVTIGRLSVLETCNIVPKYMIF